MVMEPTFKCVCVNLSDCEIKCKEIKLFQKVKF